MPPSTQRVLSNILELDPDAQRQYIDARAAFVAHELLAKQAATVRGGMVWKHVKGTDYLVRTSPAGAQKSLGPRTPNAEQIYAEFTARKAKLEDRLRTSKSSLERHKRMNKALRVGRTPSIVVHLLQALSETGLDEHFRVVGTHALYAYETTAGVRFPSAIATTMDVDLLWDTRKRIAFSQLIHNTTGSMIELLRKIDSTFEIDETDKYRAVNSKGFFVDVLRRPAAENDPHPARLSEHEDDFWVVQAERADELVNAPSFSEVIVALDGSMARMNTIDPREFARFKTWMSNLDSREPIKRQRDQLQAAAVAAIVQERMPHLQARSSPAKEVDQELDTKPPTPRMRG